MNFVDILVPMACGAGGGLLVVLASWFGLALNAYRQKILVFDLQQRVLQLYNRNANQASQAKQRVNPEDMDAIMRIAKPRTQRFSNDPLEYDFNAPKDRG